MLPTEGSGAAGSRFKPPTNSPEGGRSPLQLPQRGERRRQFRVQRPLLASPIGKGPVTPEAGVLKLEW